MAKVNNIHRRWMAKDCERRREATGRAREREALRDHLIKKRFTPETKRRRLNKKLFNCKLARGTDTNVYLWVAIFRL